LPDLLCGKRSRQRISSPRGNPGHDVNDREIGKILEYALTQPCVRGVTFQPIQAAGRLDNFDPATDRLTLTEVRREILRQTNIFRPEDVLPVPCHPDCLAMAYALKMNGKVVPLTGMIDPQVLIEGGRNRFSMSRTTPCARASSGFSPQITLPAPAQPAYATSYAACRD
jgi:hypothetical protein